MKRIGPNMVELETDEIVVKGMFEELLDRGLGIEAAIKQVRPEWPGISDEFWEWLR